MKMQIKAGSITFCLITCLIYGCSAEEKPVVPAISENITAPKNIFQPSGIDPALVRQSMQARSEYEEMNRKIMARTNKLYEDNPEIKELQEKMRDIQKKIDGLLAEDEELAKLKKKFQSIAPEITSMPRRPPPPASDKGKK